MTHYYSLNPLGINNVAFKYHEIFTFIDYLAQHDYIILGGDVYRLNDNTLESTYDSWYIEQSDLASEKAVFIAQEKTIEYINMYHRRNGDQYAYSLIFEKRGHE